MCDDLMSEERVDKLEDILGRFIVSTEASLNRLSREMLEFKDEMLEFKDEMLEFKDEMREFKDEMLEFKDEMREFKDESRETHRKMNRQWGGLANRLGTLVEDIVAPAVRPAIRKYFGCEVTDFMTRRECTNPKLSLAGEFDVIAVSDDRVFLVEVKSSPDKRYLRRFLAKTEVFRKLFPEYDDKHLTLIFASLRFDENIILLASQENIYVLAYREWDYMDILNFEDVPG